MGSMSYFTSTQHEGLYRCKAFTLTFGDGKEGGPTAPDESWQEAYVTKTIFGERRQLMFSQFNGIYEEEGELSFK